MDWSGYLAVVVLAVGCGSIFVWYKSSGSRDKPGSGSQPRPDSRLFSGRSSNEIPEYSQLSVTAEAIRKEVRYTPNSSHYAVVGLGGSGKSSFIDALRGVSYGAQGSAVVNRDFDSNPLLNVQNVISGTQIQRFPDPNMSVTWYEYPAPDTLGIPGEDYFSNQGLHLFKAVILLVDVRLMEYDIGIAQSCVSFGIPFFLVRSKSDQHIRNVRMTLQYDDDSDDEDMIQISQSAAELDSQARQQYIDPTRANFREVLNSAGLISQDFYLVSSSNLRSTVKRGLEGNGAIDESKLIKDLKAVGYSTNTSQL